MDPMGRDATSGVAWAAAVLALVACDHRPLRLHHTVELPDPVQTDDSGTTAPPAGPGKSQGCDPVAQSCGGSQHCTPDCPHAVYACLPRHPEDHGVQGI